MLIMSITGFSGLLSAHVLDVFYHIKDYKQQKESTTRKLSLIGGANKHRAEAFYLLNHVATPNSVEPAPCESDWMLCSSTKERADTKLKELFRRKLQRGWWSLRRDATFPAVVRRSARFLVKAKFRSCRAMRLPFMSSLHTRPAFARS